MVPNNNDSGQYLVEVELPSKTYKLDLGNKRINGHVDTFDATVQYIYKSILTQRYSKIIYEDFGTELEDLQGQDSDYVKAVLESRIEDSLTSDSRVTSIEDFTIYDTKNKDDIEVSFTAVTIFGNANIGPVQIQ